MYQMPNNIVSVKECDLNLHKIIQLNHPAPAPCRGNHKKLNMLNRAAGGRAAPRSEPVGGGAI